MEQKSKAGSNLADSLHNTIQIVESGFSQLSAAFVDDCEGTFKRNYDNALLHLKNQEFEEAITLMENSLRQAVKIHGQDAVELAGHYFNLGSAILSKIENSRDVFATLAAARKGNDDSEDEDDGDEDQEAQESAKLPGLATSDQLETTSKQATQVTGNQNNSEAEDTSQENPKSQSIFHKEQMNEMPAPNANNNIEEEPEDIQFAWEHLELARVFTEKKLNQYKDEGKIDEVSKVMKFLSAIHTKLGDANCYQENFKEALVDYENSLNLRKFNEDPFYSREIAEAYYLIGQAHLYINTKEADDIAVMNFHKSRIVLENILYKYLSLQGRKDPENREEHQSVLRKEFLTPNMFDQSETKELKNILFELYSKIEDTIQQRNERDQVDNEKEKVRLQNERNRELENNFGKSAFNIMNLQSQTNCKQAPSLPSTFNFSLFNSENNSNTAKNEENKNAGQTQEPPKFVKLGVFGNAAKKRMRDEVSPVPEKPENCLDAKPSLAEVDQNVTQLDQNGKPEKMVKTN